MKNTRYELSGPNKNWTEKKKRDIIKLE